MLFNGNGSGPGGTNVNLAGSLGARWLANDAWLEGTGATGLPATDGVAFQDVPGLQVAGFEALGTLAFAGGTSGNVSVALALTPGFAADVSAGGNVTLLLRPEDSAVSLVANSRQASNPANRPTLTLNASAIPEPSAVLFTSAAACVLLVRRHRRAASCRPARGLR